MKGDSPCIDESKLFMFREDLLKCFRLKDRQSKKGGNIFIKL